MLELWASLGMLELWASTHVYTYTLASGSNPHLPRFVSDHGPNGFQAVCQQRLMQGMGRAQQQGSGAARTFPPTLLEWTVTHEKASMALDVSCFNGELLVPQPLLPPVLSPLQKSSWRWWGPVNSDGGRAQ